MGEGRGLGAARENTDNWDEKNWSRAGPVLVGTAEARPHPHGLTAAAAMGLGEGGGRRSGLHPVLPNTRCGSQRTGGFW